MKWISVNEKLPPIDKNVLICIDDFSSKHICVGHYNGLSWHHFSMDCYGDNSLINVVFWAELPNYPSVQRVSKNPPQFIFAEDTWFCKCDNKVYRPNLKKQVYEAEDGTTKPIKK